MNTGRLVYVIGPSGAGKDSVLQYLLRVCTPFAGAHLARRTITRPANAGGEQHEAVAPIEFEVLQQAGAFAMTWHAHGLSYGIRHEELAPLHQGRWVFVNGSRAWLPHLQRGWPEAVVVCVEASDDVRSKRLQDRGREDSAAVMQRLTRVVDSTLPPGAVCIRNDGDLEDAVAALCLALQPLKT